VIIAETFIYELERYTIRRQPLPTNPAFATHLIYFKGKLVGRQLSVPTVSDCEWYERRHGVYATQSESHEHSAGHRIRHCASMRGGRSPNAKLSANDVREIRSSCIGKHGEQARLAEKYNVGAKTISDIVRGESWKQVGGVRIRIFHRGKLISGE
jgi:hypothetical protein